LPENQDLTPDIFLHTANLTNVVKNVDLTSVLIGRNRTDDTDKLKTIN